MKNILIIGSKLDLPGSKNNIHDIKDALGASSKSMFQANSAYIEDLLFIINDDEQKIIDTVSSSQIDDYDLVILMNWYQSGSYQYYRDIIYTVALYLNNKGVKFWNSEAINQRSTTKLSMMMLLAINNIPIPKTNFSINHNYLSEKNMPKDYPVIVKTIKGSRGANNFLAKDYEEYSRILSKKHPYMVQEFIPNDYDLRVVCFNSKPRLFIKRTRVSQETHLNNTSMGATAELIKIEDMSENVKRLAHDICSISHREIAGVDLLFANDESKRIVCLEVNAIPQLTTGSFVNEKFEAFTSSINELLGG